MGNPARKSDVLGEQSLKPADERINQVFIAEGSALNRAEHAESELKLLRTDYLNRIAGMVKAIAAVERSGAKAAEAIAHLEEISRMSAGELIEEYRLTSARFRSAFPTSFGLGPLISRKKRGVKNPGDFK